MKYTLKQCLENQKQVDASIVHHGEYNPLLAAIKEVIELADHLALIETWKKPKQVDINQAFLELVDVFAFWLSNLNLEKYPLTSFDTACVDDSLGTKKSELIKTLISWLSDGEFDAVDVIATIGYVFFDKSVDDLYRFYLAKSELTKFRQRNGYKTGDYVKMWAGLEDNEYLYNFISEGGSVEDLPSYLEDVYTAVVKMA